MPKLEVIYPPGCPTLPWSEIRKMRRNRLKGGDRAKTFAGLDASYARRKYRIPLFLWLEGDLVIDGAGRCDWIQAKAEEGWEIPDLPVIQLPAETQQEAEELAATVSSQFDDPTEETWAEFTRNWKLGPMEMKSVTAGLRFPTLDLGSFVSSHSRKVGGEDPGPSEPPKKPKTRTGDLYILGDHRLVCGDLVEQVWDGSGCFIWDPPWDADPMVPCAPHLVFADGFRVGPAIAKFGAPYWLFTWDCVSSWYTPNRPLRRAKYALSYAGLDEYDFNGSHYGDAGEPRTVTNTRGSYEFQPDPRGKHLSDVFSAPITQREDGRHPHEKPVDWLRMLIANCRPGASLIEDPCAGSGATLIASEQLGRKWIGTELSPAYCDVIVERWEKMTGQKAKRIRAKK